MGKRKKGPLRASSINKKRKRGNHDHPQQPKQTRSRLPTRRIHILVKGREHRDDSQGGGMEIIHEGWKIVNTVINGVSFQEAGTQNDRLYTLKAANNTKFNDLMLVLEACK